ncbi:MAG: sel1 repeat family protein [Hyphomicrobiales bacterium]|uniref:tetratricopeptide repeat protein n=1 Tax=Rhabdaerophilum calidifontis TaxID=2604328 RepID=UPI00140E395E|nr:tetratricopeptide repeat protein [Rhabdaerophilum calidifontis]MCA1951948.1 sel1 repeat family protein [Hyphomicrobiales bacterium]MCA1998647.1 sel1 repeat family protein [Hyphomicrobiales bacterium]
MAFALCAAGTALALDVKEGPPAPVEKGTMFKSVGESLRAGLRALSSGDPGSAVEPLTFAAREGNDIAEWKLGRMYAEGEGVPRDPYKAYVHFSQIVNRRADLAPDSPNARIVAQAFVALGGYHLTGIPNSRIRREPARAAEMFHYAASYYNDADAQYELGRMLAEGIAGEKNLQQAARWFNLAAEQGHVYAQARLGHLLFNGEGVPRQAPRGLMWMKIATASADPDRDSWVLELNRRAQAVATDDERRLADAFAKKRERNSR